MRQALSERIFDVPAVRRQGGFFAFGPGPRCANHVVMQRTEKVCARDDANHFVSTKHRHEALVMLDHPSFDLLKRSIDSGGEDLALNKVENLVLIEPMKQRLLNCLT